MKIALGSDHRGDEALAALIPRLRERGHELLVLGPNNGDSRDYPDEAWLVGRAVAAGDAERGILICGSGIGVCIAANKVPGVRAALAGSPNTAEMSRRHNDANVLCLSGDSKPPDEIERIVEAFLATDFERGRHERRLKKIEAIERGEAPMRPATHPNVSSR
jgi:ribose 5-phosphate isomerase B